MTSNIWWQPILIAVLSVAFIGAAFIHGNSIPWAYLVFGCLGIGMAGFMIAWNVRLQRRHKK